MSFQVYQAQGLRIFSGDTATVAGYTGNAGELSINTETKAVYVHDGITAGGTPLTTASEAEMLGMTLGQLANVYLTSQTDKSLLSFDLDSDSWKSIEGLKVSDLIDTAVNTPSEGDLLAYDGATQKWKNVPASTGGAGATNLTGLDDVNLVSPANDQVLSYNSSTSKWENKAAPAGGGSGGSGLPVVSYADYTVTTGGQIDDEKDATHGDYPNSGYFYTSPSTGSTNFYSQQKLGDWEVGNNDCLMLMWDFAKQKWKLIRGADFLTENTATSRYYAKNTVYTKTEVDDAIAAGAAASSGGGGGGGVPIGSLIASPLTNTTFSSTDWLLCNGSEVYQSSYPDLFAFVGYKFSPGKMLDYNTWETIPTEQECQTYQENLDPEQRRFSLPDLRDRILIGSDGQNTYNYQQREGTYGNHNFDTEGWHTHELTWNDTNAGPTYLDTSQPWINIMGVETPLMPKGRTVQYYIKAI